ncbi:MAG: hypothetical protein WAN48_11535 [Actinomycetes bacterium]
MTGKTILDKLLALRVNRPFGQFGTVDDECTDNGAIGCTHTCWRFIAFAYTGKWYSHDELSHLSGYPCGGGATNRGMRVEESQRLAAALHLPYVYRGGLTSSELLTASNKGPVLFAIRYGDWPAWRGYHGQTPPAPWARPLGKAGRNQFTWSGSHATVLLGYVRIMAGARFVRNDCYAMEPNHDSPARPENVAYDLVTQTDLNRAFQGVKRLGWAQTMAMVPTKAPTFPGGLR